MSIAQRQLPTSRSTLWMLSGLICATLLIGCYFVGRYDGRWAEIDSTTLASATRSMIDQGRLVPTKGSVYPNGFAYQSITTMLVSLTGLDLVTLQQLGYPLMVGLIVLPAWATYRELTSSDTAATLATGLLFAQPEFLFVVLRSSHEKFTRSLLFICLFLLLRSFKVRQHVGKLAIHIGLFYLAAYALIASNNLIANSFIAAIMVALGLGIALRSRVSVSLLGDSLIQRLMYVTLICLGLVYLFTFYTYPPARSNLLIIQGIWDRIAALFLDVEAQSTNPYTYVSNSWINLPTYFVLSSGNWFIIISSVVIWASLARHWLWRGGQPESYNLWLLWLLYSGFVLQGAFSIIADVSGALASNLQYRTFPSFVMLSVGLVSWFVVRWQPKWATVRLRSVGPWLVIILLILSTLKATSEPLLSNKWFFYTPDEVAILRWGDTQLRNESIWAEFDERLIVVNGLLHGPSANRNQLRGNELEPQMRVLIVSNITRMRSVRLNRPLPVPPDALRVYDNGEAQLYRVRPLTIYQR